LRRIRKTRFGTPRAWFERATAEHVRQHEHAIRSPADPQVVSVLPGDAVTHRILELPFADRKRLEQTVPFELESHLPFELDETVIDFQVLDTSADGTSGKPKRLTARRSLRSN